MRKAFRGADIISSMGTMRTLVQLAAAAGALASGIAAVVALNAGQLVVAGAAFLILIVLLAPLAWWMSRGRISRRIHRTFVLGPEEDHYIHLDIHKRSILRGEVTADAPITYVLLAADDLDRWRRRKLVGVVDLGDDVLHGTLDSGPGLDGPFLLLIENNDEDDDVEVHVSLTISPD